MNYHIAFFASNNYLKESHNKIVIGNKAVDLIKRQKNLNIN
jgi:hypothetical protein